MVKFNASKRRFLPIPAHTAELMVTASKLNFLRFPHLAKRSTNDCCVMVAMLKSKYCSLVNDTIFTSSSTNIGLAICGESGIEIQQRTATMIFYVEVRVTNVSFTHFHCIVDRVLIAESDFPSFGYFVLTLVCDKRTTTTPLRKILPRAPTFKFRPAKSNRPHSDSSDAASLKRFDTKPHRNSAFFGSHWNTDSTISYDRREKWSTPVPMCGTLRW